MEKESKTETEEIIDDTLKDDKEKSKDSDKRDEKDEEQMKTDDDKSRQSGTEADEEEQTGELTIDDYNRKIDDIDARLNEYKAKAIDNRKRMALIKAGYTEEQAERYTSYIEGETIEEIQRSIVELINNIPVQDNYADPSPMNGAKYKPEPADPGEIGKSAFERVKHKVFPSLGR